MEKILDYIAKSLAGFEDLLFDEVVEAGGTNVNKVVRGVRFKADLEVIYKLNYTSRIAISILQELTTFPVRAERDLYSGMYAIEWEKYLNSDGSLFIECVTSHKKLTHSLFLSQLSKDAIVDRFRDNKGERPSVEPYDPDLRISVHLNDRLCSISLNSSGQPLFKRGYRAAGGLAPLNEVLASGLLKMSGFDGTQNLFDPMCGSGTFLTEGAMIALNIPSGYKRASFGFQNWKNFDNELWEKVRDEADSKIKESLDISIVGADMSASAMSLARRNIQDCGVNDFVEIRRADFFKGRQGAGFKGVIIMNPPYGERIGEADVEMIYSRIGSTLKHHYTDTNAWILTGNLDALKFVGLKTSRKIKVYNGSIECRFVKYELYEGSRKLSKKSDSE